MFRENLYKPRFSRNPPEPDFPKSEKVVGEIRSCDRVLTQFAKVISLMTFSLLSVATSDVDASSSGSYGSPDPPCHDHEIQTIWIQIIQIVKTRSFAGRMLLPMGKQLICVPRLPHGQPQKGLASDRYLAAIFTTMKYTLFAQ